MDIVYDILNFKWQAESRIFSANESDLYEIQRIYSMAFPNGREKFYILNQKTNSKVRFVLEIDRPHYYLFKTDDFTPEIICIVNKEPSYE